MTITAIILNRNNYADLKECLLSLRAQKLLSGCELRTIIIDNGSTDGSTSRIREEFPQHEYIFNAENLGFARAVNQGIRQAAGGDYFLLLNNDATLEDRCLEKLIAAAADLAGPTIYYRDPADKIWQAGGYFRKSKMGVAVPLKNQNLSDGLTKEVSFLSGCVLLISRRAVESTAGLDERFFFYGEDLDLCLRAKKSGLKVAYVAAASAWHNIGVIAKNRTSAFVFRNLAFSQILVARKHFPLLIPYAIFLFLAVYTPFRMLQIIKGRQELKNILAWLQGGWSGLTIKL